MGRNLLWCINLQLNICSFLWVVYFLLLNFFYHFLLRLPPPLSINFYSNEVTNTTAVGLWVWGTFLCILSTEYFFFVGFCILYFFHFFPPSVSSSTTPPPPSHFRLLTFFFFKQNEYCFIFKVIT